MFGFNDFQKVGKGIPEDAPPKKGLALFSDIILREIWAMIALNLIFIVACIPVFTIGASWAALNSVLIKMIRDIPVDAFSDFKKGFKDNFKQSTVLTILCIVISYLLYLAYKFYQVKFEYAMYMVIILGIGLFMAGIYIIPLLVSVDLDIKGIIKNSIILAIISIKYTLPASLIMIITIATCIIFFQFSTIYLFTFGFTLIAFINCFLTYAGIKKYVIDRNDGNTTRS